MKTLLAWVKRDSDIKINRGLCENYIAANRGHFLLRERTREGEKERRRTKGKPGAGGPERTGNPGGGGRMSQWDGRGHSFEASERPRRRSDRNALGLAYTNPWRSTPEVLKLDAFGSKSEGTWGKNVQCRHRGIFLRNLRGMHIWRSVSIFRIAIG